MTLEWAKSGTVRQVLGQEKVHQQVVIFFNCPFNIISKTGVQILSSYWTFSVFARNSFEKRQGTLFITFQRELCANPRNVSCRPIGRKG
jgi:hypothetical protein